MDDKIGFPFPTTPGAGVPAATAAAKTQEKTTLEGWSWGGFMFGPVFIIGTKHYIYLLFYLAYFIPLINVIVMLGLAIYLGVKGKELAYGSTMFGSDQEAEGFIKAIDHAGKVMFFVSLIFFVIFFAIFGTMFYSLFSTMSKTKGFPNMNSFSSQQNIQVTQQLTTLGGYLGLYKNTYKKYPASLDALITAYPDKNLSQMDPWGDAIHYTQNTDGTITLVSDGPDKKPNTADDAPFTYPVVYK